MMWDEISAKLHAEIARLTRERDALLAALKPFAQVASSVDLVGSRFSNSFRILHCLGDMRHARDLLCALEQGARESEYRRLGIDPNNPNPDGSDYHLMNVVDEQTQSK